MYGEPRIVDIIPLIPRCPLWVATRRSHAKLSYISYADAEEADTQSGVPIRKGRHTHQMGSARSASFTPRGAQE
jgi:hypothetical protein